MNSFLLLFRRLRFLVPIVLACMLAAVDSGAQKVLTLEKAIEIAMSNSPAIRHTRFRLEQSRENLNAEKASLKSKFSLSLTPVDYIQSRQFNDMFSTWYTNESKQSYGSFMIEQPIKWTDGTLSLINRFEWKDSYSGFQNQTSKTYSNNLYINFEQPIFTYNRTKLELRDLELDLENNELSYAIQRLSLEQQVMQKFFEVYQKKMSYEIAVEEFSNQEENYKIINNKVEAGIASLEELYQAEVNLSNSKMKVQAAQVDLDNLEDDLKRLIGLSLFEEVSVEADVSYKHVNVDLSKALEHGLKYRMELRQHQIDIENAQSDLIRTGAQNEFRGTISVSYGSMGTDESFSNIYDSPDKNQQFALTLNVPLWDWGEKRSKIKASKAAVKNSKLYLEDQENDIIISIKKADRNLKNQEIQIDIARRSVRSAKLTYDINLEKYKNGDLTSMDLNRIQIQLSDARISEVNALINYRLALLEMKIQSLWNFEEDRSALDIDK